MKPGGWRTGRDRTSAFTCIRGSRLWNPRFPGPALRPLGTSGQRRVRGGLDAPLSEQPCDYGDCCLLPQAHRLPPTRGPNRVAPDDRITGMAGDLPPYPWGTIMRRKPDAGHPTSRRASVPLP
jgi:hypothetical protein